MKWLFAVLALVAGYGVQSAQAQVNAPSDRWSPAVRDVLLAKPLAAELERPEHLELVRTWKAAVTPAFEGLVGKDGLISATVFRRVDDAGAGYLLFTARGQSPSRGTVPAFEGTSARNYPSVQVEYQIMLHRPDLAQAATNNGKDIIETRGDGNVSMITSADGDHVITVNAYSADGSADARDVCERIRTMLSDAAVDHFPYALKVNPIVPSAAEAMAAPKPKAPEARAEGEEPTDTLIYVKMSTNKGDIVLGLNETKAPISVANFLMYVDAGHYDGTIFHRVMSDFMIQGGGFTPDMNQKPTRQGIRNEWQNGLKNTIGTIAMARMPNQPDSATTQFFINVKNNPMLDESRDGAGYAVFGKVVEGMETVEAIRYVGVGSGPNGMQNVPTERVLIEKVERLEGWKPKPAAAVSSPSLPY
jgi:cyclophilin family peptidyl-prolyl cis-trans isomerase